MPWSYRDLTKVSYVPALAPRDPLSVHGLVETLFRSGPGSYLIVDQTQIAALQQTASYAPDWGSRFRASVSSAATVRVAFASDSAVVYTMQWPSTSATPAPEYQHGFGSSGSIHLDPSRTDRLLAACGPARGA